MKILAVLSALLLTFPAHASDLAETSEVLTQVEVDGAASGLTGILNLDLSNSKIGIALYSDPCGSLLPSAPGQVKCLAAASLRETLEVQIQDVEFECGSQIYRGVNDQTPVDGPRVEIEVTDHEGRVCRDLIRSRLVIKATSFNPWTGKTTEYLLKK